MYIEVANQASMTFTFGADPFSRSFEIRVSQYLCDSAQRPPEGCLQYHTGTDGRITSFNWAGANGHLQNQKYTICLRQELGFCCTKYQVCDGEAGGFSIDLTVDGTTGFGLTEELCTSDYILIPSSSTSGNLNLNTNRYCGEKLNGAAIAQAENAFVTGKKKTGLAKQQLLKPNYNFTDCTAPFTVTLVTDDAADAAVPTDLAMTQGLCLEYMQVPCQSVNLG